MTGRLLQTVLRQAGALAAEAGPDAVPDAELLARFAAGRDESAFAALVRRHGPMVWAACRHLLPHDADAEDAFQATFLALVRSAGTVRAGSAVGGWLHGVAVRAAMRIRRSAARRRRREMRVAGPESGRPVPDAAWDRVLAAVHEEVQQLPEALRAAFVLCDLEGVRQPDAAARLGWKPGTLSGRLAKARQRLLDRLARRGIAAGVAAGALGVGAAAGGAVPAALAGKVLTLAGAGADAAPPALLELLAEVTPMTVNRAKLIAAAALVAGGLAVGAGATLLPTADAQPPTGPGAPGGPGAGPTAGDPPGMPGTTGMSGSAGTTRRVPSTPPWEYKFDDLPWSVEESHKLIEARGREGWELATAVTVHAAAAGSGPGDPALGPPSREVTQLVFKRPVRSGGSGGSGGGGPVTGGRFGGMGSPGMGSPMGGPGGLMGAGGLGGPPPGMPPGMGGAGSPGGRGGRDGGPGSAGGDGATFGGFHVIAVKNAAAPDLSATLQQLYANSGVALQVVPDSRTNSLIVKTDADTLREIQALVQKLDAPGHEGGNPAGGSNPFGPRR